MLPTKYDLPCTAPWPFNPCAPTRHLPGTGGTSEWQALQAVYADTGKRLADWLYSSVPAPVVDTMLATLQRYASNPREGATVRVPFLPVMEDVA